MRALADDWKPLNNAPESLGRALLWRPEFPEEILEIVRPAPNEDYEVYEGWGVEAERLHPLPTFPKDRTRDQFLPVSPGGGFQPLV